MSLFSAPSLRHGGLAAGYLLSIGIIAPMIVQTVARADEIALAYPLDDIVVTPTKTPLSFSQVGASVTVIDRADLEIRRTRLVTDILREVPGLAVNQAAQTGSLTQVRIRGAEANHTLVLIDGVEASDPQTNEFDFGQLLSADIERIEILRGPQSMLYGADASAGVISITTRRGRGAPKLDGSIEGGSYRTYNARTNLSGSIDRLDYNLSLAKLSTAGVEVTRQSEGGHENDQYQNETLSFKLGADLIRDLGPVDGLEVIVSGRRTWSEGQADNQDFAVTGLAFDDDRPFENMQSFGHVDADLSLLDGRWRNALGFGYTAHRNEFEGAQHRFADTDKWRLDFQTDVIPIEPVTLSVGYDLERNWDNRTGIQNATIHARGYWGQVQIDLFDRLHLTGGYRHDNNSFFGTANTYRFTAAYSHLETGTKLRAGVGTGFSPPSFSEIFFTPSPFFVANPNLQPEEIFSWEVGVDQSFWDERAIVGLTWFRNDIENLIAFDGTVFPFTLNNLASSRSFGIEAFGTVRPTDRLSLNLSYTFTDSEDSTGQALIRRPRHLASVTGVWQFLPEAEATVSVIYNGAVQDAFFGAGGGRRILDDYTLVNLGLNYDIEAEPLALTLFGRVENILDDRHEQVFGFESGGIAAFAGLSARY